MFEKTKIFVSKAISIHGDKYNYEQVICNAFSHKVKIVCEKHGVFEQLASSHLSGRGCVHCYKEKSGTYKNNFIEKAKKVHGDKYNYEHTVYKNRKSKVKIVCKLHGEFEQLAASHLAGQGCIHCYKKNLVTCQNDFIEKAKKIHGDKYNYEHTVYKNSRTKVKIVCKIHGEFEQRSFDHLKGRGCIYCANDKLRCSKDLFLEKAKKIHGKLYSYDEVIYINSKEKIKIVCKKHGVFKQTPNDHLKGAGCSLCCRSRGEISISNVLKEYGIFFKEQATFSGCVGKTGSNLKFDFYISSLNLAIEFDGEQHFKSIEAFGGKSKYLTQRLNDSIKNTYCESNRINLLRIKYNEDIKQSISYMLDLIENKKYACVFYGKEVFNENIIVT